MSLTAHALAVERAGVPALHGLDVAFAVGEITVICGPNGAGKSTLLAALAGLVAPSAGSVALDGRALGTVPASERARAIGYLPQSGAVAWDVSVETLVGLGRLPWRGSATDDRAAVAAALAAMDLVGLASRPMSRLSGGERARALLARVLAGKPRWILADEPLAALDLAHQLSLLGRLRSFAAQGFGVVLVVHDLALAMNFASRVVVLDSGRLAAEGPPETALASETIARVWGVEAHWLGEPGARALVAEPNAAVTPITIRV